jgi:hypothetical protein
VVAAKSEDCWSRSGRTRWVFFYCDDYSFFDVERLLRGEVELLPMRQLTAIAIVGGREVSISDADLELLLALSSEDWRDVDESPRLRELAADGLVFLDDPDPELVALRELDERLDKNAWNAYAALFHGLSRRRGMDVDLAESEHESGDTIVAGALDAFVERHGPPPPHFHTPPNALARRELAIPERDGQLYDALAARRTTRIFERADRRADLASSSTTRSAVTAR